MNFSYIDAMENYWAVYFTQGGLTERDFLVFSYLVHMCNSLRGKNPFQCESRRACLILKIVDKAGKPAPQLFARCQKRLVSAGLIVWTKGRKGVAPTYEIVVPRKRARSGVVDTVSDVVIHQSNFPHINDSKTADSVSDSVTLPVMDNKMEGGSKAHPQDFIALAENHPRWKRLEAECLQRIAEKFVQHYAAKPHMVNESRWLGWLDGEHSKNLQWKPRELPLMPSEPEGWQRLRFKEYPAESRVHGLDWTGICEKFPELALRWADMCEGKCDV